MNEQSKMLVRRWYDEVWDKGKLSALNELVSPNYTPHEPHVRELPHGVEGAKQFVNLYRTAFPDAQHDIQEQLTEGDKVVTRFTMRGTHRGDFLGIPATGKRANISGISIEKIANGKITESWMDLDLLSLMQQIGAVPSFAMSHN